MSAEHRQDPDPVSLSSEDERDRAIAEVLRHQRERAQAQERAWEVLAREERRRGFGIRHLVFAAALLVSGYVWLAAPSWAGMDAPAPPTAQRLDASLRLALYVQAQRVEAFVAEHDRLPRTLEEVGPPLPGIRYTPTPRGTFHLLGTNGDRSLFYSSSLTLSPAAFLGASEGTIFPSGAFP